MKFVFCDYLDANKVIYYPTKVEQYVLVSDIWKEEPEEISRIEAYLVQQVKQKNGVE